MTRIVGGLAGGAKLHVPGPGTRPTSERVREAIFNALDARGLCDGAHVLDLFSGSGALGLEAASRGAESVVLVERERGAANVAQRNAEIVAKAGAVRALVEQVAVHQYLQRSGRQFDLVFVDHMDRVLKEALSGERAEEIFAARRRTRDAAVDHTDDDPGSTGDGGESEPPRDPLPST